MCEADSCSDGWWAGRAEQQWQPPGQVTGSAWCTTRMEAEMTTISVKVWCEGW